MRRIIFSAVINIAFSVQAFGQIQALSARLLGNIGGVAADASGNVFMALPNANIVLRLDPQGILTVAAGNGTQGFGGDNGPATIAQLNSPTGVAIGPGGSLYIVENDSTRIGNQIRLVSNGVISTVAGGGSDFYSDNISATSARLGVPFGKGIAVDTAGNLYVVSFDRIRKVSNGLITTLLQGGQQSPLVFPDNIALDSAGNVYFTDPCAARVFKLSNGSITTVAGNGTQGFFSCAPTASTGDGGSATSASLYRPAAITLDAAGAVYVMEQNPAGGRVRRISNGIISTVAGGGPSDLNDNIPATSTWLFNAGADITTDTAGNLFIGDAYNTTLTARLRKVSGGIITTVAGAAGGVCPNDYLVTVTPALFPVSGGTSNATFAINADRSCHWTVVGLPSWIAVAGQDSGIGPATVDLSVLANPGTERSATIQVAGVFVTVTQAACTYSLSAGGQAFPSQGGSGTIAITTGAGCPWTVDTPPAGVTFTSPLSGAGSNAVSYQVFPNSGGASPGVLTIAGQVFAIEQQAASIPGLSFIGSMPHLAGEENWTTAFTLVNKTPSSTLARVSLFGDALNPGGNGPLLMPLVFPQQAAASVPFLATSLDRTLSSNASLVITTAGPQTPPVLVGSAQLAATGAVDGFAIFHQTVTTQEAVVPLETRNASSYVLAFDNTHGLVMGVAVENVSAQNAVIPIIIRDDTGAIISAAGTTISLGANGHTSFVLSDAALGFPITANRRGTIEFDTPPGGQISVLGLRFTPPNNALTTIPALANVGTRGGSIAHLASGGDGWQTTFVLVNTGTTPAPATLSFLADQTGLPQALPLTFPQGSIADMTASSVTQTLAPGATLIIVSSGAPQLITGSAQLSTTGHVSGFVIFRHNGQEAVVPLESRDANSYVIAFDNTGGTATGIALSAVSPAALVNVLVVVRDDAGTLLGGDVIALAPSGHYAFTLGSDRYPATAAIRGTIEFVKPVSAQIAALGIRIPAGPAHTYTTLPALAK